MRSPVEAIHSDDARGKKMKVIIPLAGLGTRLRPHTYTRPKPLVPVAGKAVLGHVLDRIAPLNPQELIFITGYLGDQVESYVKAHYPYPARYVEQTERRGQSHAVQLARPYIDQPVLIVFVDTIFEADMSVLPNLQSDGAIYIKEVDDPARFGVVELRDGTIYRLVEKPKEFVSNLAVIGVYYLRNWQLLFECIEWQMANTPSTGGEYFLADALQLMINRGARLEALPVSVWEDCGTKDALLQTNRYLLGVSTQPEPLLPTCTVIPPVSVAPTARVRHSVIGPYVSLGANTRVENCVLRDCIVGEGSELRDVALRNSLIGNNATVHGGVRSVNVGDASEIRFE
jgi:glucose-1-phosphate thymidylyltransferase